MVVRIQGRNIFGFSASLALTAAGEQRLDDFVAKDNKRGHGAKPFAGRAIAVRGTDPLDQVWSLGWKAAFTAVILDQNRVLRYESAATVS